MRRPMPTTGALRSPGRRQILLIALTAALLVAVPGTTFATDPTATPTPTPTPASEPTPTPTPDPTATPTPEPTPTPTPT
ncbi:MAG: hypothetical protein WEG56_06775, partial [Chloroflexota bacterium]